MAHGIDAVNTSTGPSYLGCALTQKAMTSRDHD